MQIPPLNLTDLYLLLTFGSIILLSATEFLSIRYGQLNLIINRRKLRNVAFAIGSSLLLLFIITAINIIGIA